MPTFDLGDFPLLTGVTLPGAKLSYTTHGTLSPSKDNAILFPNFLGGSPAALEVWIGPGRPLDPEKYFIILPGHFGSDPTSSPSNTPPPFDRGAFPAIHIADDVIAQHKMLTEQFGITQLQLILGWSVGALQTYEWAVRFPDFIRRVASIAGAPRPSAWTRLWLQTVVVDPIVTDPAWDGGFYADGRAVQGGARRQAHIAALTLPPGRFYREEIWKNLGFASVDDFVARFWEGFWLSQDPNNGVTQARKARLADPAHGGDIAEALGKIKAKTVVVAFTGDPMFPPEECKVDAQRIPGATFHEVPSDFGHMATFALSPKDTAAVDEILRTHLQS
ncbi:MAG: alpha/beta fold hydrolase [Isosphaeraceae bacterium]